MIDCMNVRHLKETYFLSLKTMKGHPAGYLFIHLFILVVVITSRYRTLADFPNGFSEPVTSYRALSLR